MNYKCRICSEKEKIEFLYPKEMCIGLRQAFPYVYCLACSSLSISEVPKDFELYYSKYPWSVNPIQEKALKKKLLKKLAVKKISFLSKLFVRYLSSFDELRILSLYPYNFSKNSKILDIGCGSGQFVYELGELGFKNALGIDPFLPNDHKFQNSSEIKKLDISEIPTDCCFDLITLHHSLEHIENLEHLIKDVSRLLAPNGFCIIRIPNIESFSFYHFKENWEGIHPPFHLTLPSFQGMQRLFQNSDLVLKERRAEQLSESFLFSENRKYNICDYEELGARKFLNDKPLKRQIPPIFTKSEIRFWQEKAKTLLKTHLTDFITYYYQKV